MKGIYVVRSTKYLISKVKTSRVSIFRLPQETGGHHGYSTVPVRVFATSVGELVNDGKQTSLRCVAMIFVIKLLDISSRVAVAVLARFGIVCSFENWDGTVVIKIKWLVKRKGEIQRQTLFFKHHVYSKTLTSSLLLAVRSEPFQAPSTSPFFLALRCLRYTRNFSLLFRPRAPNW